MSPCPWCLNPIGANEAAGEICPHCGQHLLSESGLPMRSIDVRYDNETQRLEFSTGELLKNGVIASVLISGVLSLSSVLFPGASTLTSVLSSPIWAIAHLIALRIWVTGPSMRLMTRPRKTFSKAVLRISFLFFGTIGYSLLAIPVANLILVPLVFSGLTMGASRYVAWSLHREKHRIGLHWLEWGTLFFLTSLLILSILILGSIAWLTGTLIQWLMSLLGNL
jgi:hypothetical protein